jgi:hypothetical protein
MQMKDKKGNEKEKESLPSDLIPTGIQNKTKAHPGSIQMLQAKALSSSRCQGTQFRGTVCFPHFAGNGV